MSSIRAQAEEHLGAIAALLGELGDATGGYRIRPLDWGDVASLLRVRQRLADAVQAFGTAEAAAELARAAREVAIQVRRLRVTDPTQR